MKNYDYYIFYDKPVLYKRFGHEKEKEPKVLKIYPVRMEDYGMLSFLSSVLTLDIYSIPDAKIWDMNYLEYLIKHSNKENQYMDLLGNLLSLVLKVSLPQIQQPDENNESIFIIIDGIKYTPEDFEEIRQIIATQNMLEIPNHRIDKRIRDSMKEHREIKQRLSGKEPASLEDYMVSLSISTGMNLENIYNMTIRKFWMSIERVDHKLHYEIFMAASMSGFVKFKKKDAIQHWLTSLKKDEFSGLMSYEELEGKTK